MLWLLNSVFCPNILYIRNWIYNKGAAAFLHWEKKREGWLRVRGLSGIRDYFSTCACHTPSPTLPNVLPSTYLVGSVAKLAPVWCAFSDNTVINHEIILWSNSLHNRLRSGGGGVDLLFPCCMCEHLLLGKIQRAQSWLLWRPIMNEAYANHTPKWYPWRK